MNFIFRLEIVVTKSRKTHKYDKNNKYIGIKTKQSYCKSAKTNLGTKISSDGQRLNENVSSKTFNKQIWLHK